MAAELRITMAGRAVVAAGEPFVARKRTLADVGVALDEISDMRPGVEPMVLRVEAVGGDAEEREPLQGDWLCDADGSAPQKLPGARWMYERASIEWSRAMTWIDAWETSTNPRWMLHAVGWVGLGRKEMARAACACVKLIEEGVRGLYGAEPASRALRLTEEWAAGHRSGRSSLQRQVRAAVIAAEVAARRAGSHRIQRIYEACAMVAQMADERRVQGEYVGDATWAVSYVVSSYPEEEQREESMRACADAVRSSIRTIDVLRAVAREAALCAELNDSD